MEAAEDADLNHEYNSSLEVSLSWSVTKCGTQPGAPLKFLGRSGIALSAGHSAPPDTAASLRHPCWQISDLETLKGFVPLALGGEGFGKILGCIIVALLLLHGDVLVQIGWHFVGYLTGK